MVRFVGCQCCLVRTCQASAKLALSIADLQVGVMAWWVVVVALKNSDLQNRFGWICLTYSMAPGPKVSGCIPKLYHLQLELAGTIRINYSSCYHHCMTTPKRKSSPKETSHVLFQENRSGRALHPIIRFDWHIARRDKIRMWCDARSYEEVLNIAEPSGWLDGVRMGSDLMYGMDRCFFLWRWMRKG